MFANACTLARQFTRSVVMSHRLPNGKCAASIGAFVIINNEGWALTANHLLVHRETQIQAVRDHRQYEVDKRAIEGNGTLTDKQRRRQLQQLTKPKASAPCNFSDWWAWDGVRLAEAKALEAVDLAVVRLEPFDPGWITLYPTFKDPAQGLDPGTALCKMGFPFHDIEPKFDNTRNVFELPPGSVPPPFFPIDGILTRFGNVSLPGPNQRPYPLQYLETSTPGLRGQSGGPIFDTQGTVWGIQSHTAHYALGFNPPVPNGKPGQSEHQFLNVGRGVHPATIVGMLRELNINFSVSTY